MVGEVVADQRVITSGLHADDRVIVNGLMRARPNQKVTPQSEKPSPTIPGSPQAKADSSAFQPKAE